MFDFRRQQKYRSSSSNLIQKFCIEFCIAVHGSTNRGQSLLLEQAAELRKMVTVSDGGSAPGQIKGKSLCLFWIILSRELMRKLMTC